MSTTRAFIYGSISEGSEPSRPMCEPDLQVDDEEGYRGESTSDCDPLPCEDCLEGVDDGRARHRARGNGKVWWTDYEEPDKPVEEFTAREVGVHGEVLAARYLTSRGMRVIAQNWRSKAGEVDIVAREEDGEVALVEVKTRLDLDGDPSCMPELAVDGRKQRRYRKIALVYLMCHPEVVKMRFDVIAINILDRHNARLRHLVSAFSWDS